MACGSPRSPNAHAAAQRTASQSSPSAWMSAGTAWGSPSLPNASADAAANSTVAIPQCLDERGHGRSAYLHQRLRCRTANIPELAHPPVPWMSAGTAGAPNPTTTSRTCVQVSARISTPHAPCAATCATACGKSSIGCPSVCSASRAASSPACAHTLSGGTAWGSPSLRPTPPLTHGEHSSLKRSPSAWMSAGTAGAPNPTTTSRTCVQVSARISTPHAPCAATCATACGKSSIGCPSLCSASRAASSPACAHTLSAGTAWGSPIATNASACRTANIVQIIPQCLDERGDGLGVADCAQRFRCRSGEHP
jgi:hypothetical protein